ncbi:hypothetical protein [Streptococcus oralis]|uniref:hypothetical protein n=1 Tax=Streptococcus oralis TaxID=1303 RepID=UPI001F5166A0|nr:hypothetical protein [Streptococcus oralis]MCY7112334.1 hypothetical protein [Streptococcus oralis]
MIHTSPSGRKRTFSCNHSFAQIVFCNELYRRVNWNNHGCKSIVWRYISRLEITHAEAPCENRIKELQDFIAKQKTDITEFDETLVKKLIEKVAVFSGHFTVEFKSGLTINI